MFKKKILIFLSDLVAIVHFFVKKIVSFAITRRGEGKKRLRILVYHSVSTDSFHKDLDENNVRLDAFKQQMAILKKTSRKIVSLTEGINGLVRRDLPRDSIAITFDDGMLDVYEEALGVLEDFNIPATFFVVYKYADSEKGPSQSDTFQKGGFMNWRMISSLKEKGLEIGSHSYSHKGLRTLGDEDLHREIVYAKKKFEERGIPVEYFAYPYGFYRDFSNKTEALIKEAGHKACLTNIMGDNSPGDNLFRLKRTRISWRDNSFRFKMKIGGAYDWVDVLKYKLSRDKK